MWARSRLRDRRGSRGSTSWSPSRTRGSCPARSGTCSRDSASRSPIRQPCLPRVVRGCRGEYAVTIWRSHSARGSLRVAGTVFEEVAQGVLVERGDAELLRLGQLRAGALTDHDVAGLLRHAAGDLAAARLELRLGLLA